MFHNWQLHYLIHRIIVILIFDWCKYLFMVPFIHNFRFQLFWSVLCPLNCCIHLLYYISQCEALWWRIDLVRLLHPCNLFKSQQIFVWRFIAFQVLTDWNCNNYFVFPLYMPLQRNLYNLKGNRREISISQRMNAHNMHGFHVSL